MALAGAGVALCPAYVVGVGDVAAGRLVAPFGRADLTLGVHAVYPGVAPPDGPGARLRRLPRPSVPGRRLIRTGRRSPLRLASGSRTGRFHEPGSAEFALRAMTGPAAPPTMVIGHALCRGQLPRPPQEDRPRGLTQRTDHLPSASDFPALTSPVTLAGRRLRNRVAHASMTTRMQKDGAVTDALIPVLRQPGPKVARRSSCRSRWPFWPARRSSPRCGSGMRPMPTACVGGPTRWRRMIPCLLAQVQDPGRGRHHTGRSVNAIAPSALPDDLSWSMPLALTADAVRSMIDEFADGAARLAGYGFAGVEISAGHGHLFHQFLSPHSKPPHRRVRRRLDEPARGFSPTWSPPSKAACGPGFILGLKLPGDDWRRGRHRPGRGGDHRRPADPQRRGRLRLLRPGAPICPVARHAPARPLWAAHALSGVDRDASGRRATACR